MNIEQLNRQALQDNPILQSLHACAKENSTQLYLVGGSVRDLLLNRPTTDYDFTLESDAVVFAKIFAESISAPCIPLEENPPTARVIIRPSRRVPTEICLDFAQFRAATLEADLRLRDLTINTMAIPLESILDSDYPEIIDPCNGVKDLETHKLCYPSEQVILDDPLRLMRIFRFAAQLGFEMSHKSIALVEKHKQLLPLVSNERIREELLKILNTEKSKLYLNEMYEIGLLSHVFHSLDIQIVNWILLEDFEDTPIPVALSTHQTEIETYLNEELGQYANRRSLIKLSILLQENIRELGSQLCLSRRAMQFMKCLVTENQRLIDGELTEKSIIDFLRSTGSEWWGVLLFSAVLHQLPAQVLKQIADTYFQHFLPIVKQGRLISGEELIEKFQLKEGKEIGRLLKQVEDMQFYGEVRTQEEAFAVVEKLLSEDENAS